TLYRYVLDDLYEHPALETDVRELQKLYQLHRRHTVDEYSLKERAKHFSTN
ncbi:rap guanine nucleotide exchange factor 5-like isoform X1, partial [Lates japonicus]